MLRELQRQVSHPDAKQQQQLQQQQQLPQVLSDPLAPTTPQTAQVGPRQHTRICPVLHFPTCHTSGSSAPPLHQRTYSAFPLRSFRAQARLQEAELQLSDCRKQLSDARSAAAEAAAALAAERAARFAAEDRDAVRQGLLDRLAALQVGACVSGAKALLHNLGERAPFSCRRIMLSKVMQVACRKACSHIILTHARTMLCFWLALLSPPRLRLRGCMVRCWQRSGLWLHCGMSSP